MSASTKVVKAKKIGPGCQNKKRIIPKKKKNCKSLNNKSKNDEAFKEKDHQDKITRDENVSEELQQCDKSNHDSTDGNTKNDSETEKSDTVLCKFNCSDKFTEDERNKLFREFWAIANLQGQRIFISNHMQNVTPHYKYVRVDGKPTRK